MFVEQLGRACLLSLALMGSGCEGPLTDNLTPVPVFRGDGFTISRVTPGIFRVHASDDSSEIARRDLFQGVQKLVDRCGEPSYRIIPKGGDRNRDAELAFRNDNCFPGK